MTENSTELARPLVIGHKRDGRNCYDPEAKRELVEACLRPGVSVAQLAMRHGVNANLLRSWIEQYRKKSETQVKPVEPSDLPAFIPVCSGSMARLPPVVRVRSGLCATLPNGIVLDMSGMDCTELSRILACLATLPCSASTPA